MTSTFDLMRVEQNLSRRGFAFIALKPHRHDEPLRNRQSRIHAAGSAVPVHAANSTFFNPGASTNRMAKATRYALAAMIIKLT
jgi:hypothetical protein